MMSTPLARLLLFIGPICFVSPAHAHKLRPAGVPVTVADSSVTVSPRRDWNSLSKRIGKATETWTIDGEQLNDLTFYGGIPWGSPLVKERNKKREPLPKFSKTTLLVEIPELLENTYRTYKNSGSFQILSTESMPFLGVEGVRFSFEYTDNDELTRTGEARATIIKGKLFMMTFEAPRIGYFEKHLPEFTAIAGSARLR